MMRLFFLVFSTGLQRVGTISITNKGYVVCWQRD